MMQVSWTLCEASILSASLKFERQLVVLYTCLARILLSLLWQQPLLDHYCIQSHRRQQTWQQGCHGVRSLASLVPQVTRCTHRTRHRHLKKAMQTILFHKYCAQGQGTTTRKDHKFMFIISHLILCCFSWFVLCILGNVQEADSHDTRIKNIKDYETALVSLRDCRPWIMEDAARCKSLMMTLRLACSTLSAASASDA